jgi:hypothetical protein
MLSLSRLSKALAVFLPALSFAATATPGAKLVNRFNDWALFDHDTPQMRTCFVLLGPKSSEPAAAKRDSIYFYVSAWPREGVKSEVSVKVGYPLKKGSEVTVTVGANTFKLFTRDDRAFIAEPADEQKLLDALRKGSTMVVQGTSERGTVTKDTYSLAGAPRALQTLLSTCR